MKNLLSLNLLNNKNYVLWILCEKGSIKAFVSDRIVTLTKGVFCFTSFLCPFHLISFSEGTKVSVLYDDIYDQRFVLLMQPIITSLHKIRSHDNPTFPLSKEFITKFHDTVSSIQRITDKIHSETDSIKKELLEYSAILKRRDFILDLTLQRLEDGYNYQGKANNRQSKLFCNFLNSIYENCKTQHTITFYAQQANLSNSHFTKNVYNFSGTTPAKWIKRITLTLIQIDLIVHHHSVQRIISEYNFSSDSHFLKFFKANAGVTPQQYIKMNS